MTNKFFFFKTATTTTTTLLEKMIKVYSDIESLFFNADFIIFIRGSSKQNLNVNYDHPIRNRMQLVTLIIPCERSTFWPQNI